MDFSIVEDKGVLIFSASAGDDPNIANGFAGVAGLRLAELSLNTAFLMSKSPSMLLFQASASLALRDSVLELVGFYAKSDWALSCEMHDFDFANLRDMYDDLFGGPLHLTQHEVVFKELALIATPSGLTISGHVTVEGHASAAAVITMKRTGLYISGQVGDVMLSDGIVLKEAAIDIFIGQQQDTEKEGPGTSFKFAVTGKVEISVQQISATLFLDRNSKETVNWTLVGSFNGGFSLASVAPALKGTFMDMSLGDARLIISIVYVGPVYPSDLGVAAGLTVGDVSGKAALLVSELPEDELIKFEVDNLGITDVVKFASLLLEEDIPQPNDFLRFKKLKLYLSTGVTIGRILYPAGASFSCDALIFGHEVSVECAVDKSKKLVQVKGSLQAIDIGPLSIAGFYQGKPLRLDVEIGPGFQTILFDGGVRILDFQTRVYIDAELLPLPKFHLKAELRFSEHLVFNLEAMMQGDKGFSGGVSELKTLSFYIHFFFHQDILDHVVAQIHAQILTAKHAVERNLDDAIEVFNKALEIAVNELRSAREVKKVEIDKAKQKVDDAQRTADSDIDEHLKKVNNAKDDMQRRFGDAVNKIQHADDEVKGCERRVAEAQRHVDEKRAILDGAAWYNKIGPGLDVAGAEIELVSVKGALEIADGVLKLARDVVEDVGYKAAKVTIEEYENLLRGARTAADKSLGLVKSGLQETIDAQSKLVSAAEIAEREIRESGVEKLAVDDAKRVLQEFQQAEASITSGLERVVNDVAKGVEAATLDLATITLNFARANSQAVDTARNALSFAQTAVDTALDVSDWVVTRAINILNIREIEVTGDLGAVCERKSKLKARITGTFAEHEVDVSIDFTPGDGEELIKELFEELMDKVKSGIISIAKHH
ncbi:hypothetical protein COL922a_010172 [Colletotrichum nupharicola]|nr:hypothetical protein COL922a_010172 [Colletotrichum nupharicola]